MVGLLTCSNPAKGSPLLVVRVIVGLDMLYIYTCSEEGVLDMVEAEYRFGPRHGCL